MSATIQGLLGLARARTPEKVMERSTENGQVPYPEHVASDWADFLRGVGGA